MEDLDNLYPVSSVFMSDMGKKYPGACYIRTSMNGYRKEFRYHERVFDILKRIEEIERRMLLEALNAMRSIVFCQDISALDSFLQSLRAMSPKFILSLFS